MGNTPCHPTEGCGHGQNCIVTRRRLGAFVHEDAVLAAAGLPPRACCAAEPTAAQQAAFDDFFRASEADAYVIPAAGAFLPRAVQAAPAPSPQNEGPAPSAGARSGT